MPSNLCPCCGQTIKDVVFKVCLDYNTVIIGDRAVQVQPKHAELLFLLRKHYPHVVHVERLLTQVWANQLVNDNAVRTTVYQVRKAIEPFGYTIRNSAKMGYRLTKLAS